MVKYRKFHSSVESNGFFITSKRLDVHLYQYSFSFIQPSESEVRMNSVVKYSVGDLATRRCANRKLDNWGVAIGHSGIVNSKVIMKKIS